MSTKATSKKHMRGRQRAKISSRQLRRIVQELDQENRMLRACLGAACRERVEELTADVGDFERPEDTGLPAFSFRPEELAEQERGEPYVDEHGDHIVVRWTPPKGWRQDEGDHDEG